MMEEDGRRCAPRDAARINVDDEQELRYWAERLGVSRVQLRALVAEFGSSARKVREALRYGVLEPEARG